MKRDTLFRFRGGGVWEQEAQEALLEGRGEGRDMHGIAIDG